MTKHTRQENSFPIKPACSLRVIKKSGAARGFVALMSILIISAILLTLVYTLNASSFFARLDALGAENKRTSLSLAEACVNAAILKIAQAAAVPTSYTTASAAGDCVSLGGTCGASGPQKICKICRTGTSYTSGASTASVATRAQYNGSYSNIQVAISLAPSSYSVTSWKETETGDPSCTLP